ncbi:MAG TPA: double zinc ribbon domain-containing protein [Blastocatellia bacterium]|nr:double zinc ribbon domain-containing protein [Blastocatellia bacterium]
MRASQSHNPRPPGEPPRGERLRGAASRAGAIASLLRRVRDGLMASAYPEQCRVCGGAVESYDDGVACEDCWLDSTITKMIGGAACHKCGAPLYDRAGRRQLCGTCAEFPFSAARCCGVYSGALEASILFLKSHPHVCRRLREMISRTFSDHLPALASDVVIPVPLHRLRERGRGFNQAKIIAKVIARDFQIRLDDRALVRARATERHRVGLDAVDRKKSVERAFSVTRPTLVGGLSVLLVDDLFTTGSTISAASNALLEAGARRVNVLTVARVEDRARAALKK